MTRLSRRFALIAALATSIAIGRAAPAARQSARPTVIPFELATRHIVVEARINQSRPLWVVFDTGADRAVIKTDVARELGLELEGQVGLRGAGSGMQSGSRVKGARWSLPGLQGFSQPVAIAVPLPNISSTMGRAIDGIIKTVRVMGVGAGGAVAGRLGRVTALQIGSVALTSPIALFSQDRAGSFANSALAGNIGAQVGNRFRIFLDYGRKRIVFEPQATLNDPYDRAFSGLGLRAFGDDFRTFRVFDLLEDSPATAAGIQKNDVIVAIDGVPADRLTLSAINEMLEKPIKYTLTIRRAETTLTVSLTPARLI